MPYPHIKFRKSAKKDFGTLIGFAREAKYSNGRTINWAIFKKYPQLEQYFDKDNNYKIRNEKVLRYFVKEAYHGKQIKMNRVLVQHKKRWEKIAPAYFSLVDSLFRNRKWPKGKYIAYGTIWGMYPRFLEDKTFQIPFYPRATWSTSYVIAHEMLHFMFYDYFFKYYPKYKHSKHNMFVWHISEIFNVVVQNSPLWFDIFKTKSLGYPEHEKIVKCVDGFWKRDDNHNVDKLIDKIIREVKRSSKLFGIKS